MTRNIVLLRGVNLGGANLLPMKAFAGLLEELGCTEVKTYIQSGNAVVRGGVSAEDVGARIAAHFGFRPRVFVISAPALEKVAARCPFAAAGDAAPKSVHVFFMDAAPATKDVEALGALKRPSEDFAVAGTVLYLHAPQGVAPSKIAEKIDRTLNLTTTARNWNTVRALIDLAKDPA